MKTYGKSLVLIFGLSLIATYSSPLEKKLTKEITELKQNINTTKSNIDSMQTTIAQTEQKLNQIASTASYGAYTITSPLNPEDQVDAADLEVIASAEQQAIDLHSTPIGTSREALIKKVCETYNTYRKVIENLKKITTNEKLIAQLDSAIGNSTPGKITNLKVAQAMSTETPAIVPKAPVKPMEPVVTGKEEDNDEEEAKPATKPEEPMEKIAEPTSEEPMEKVTPEETPAALEEPMEKVVKPEEEPTEEIAEPMGEEPAAEPMEKITPEETPAALEEPMEKVVKPEEEPTEEIAEPKGEEPMEKVTPEETPAALEEPMEKVAKPEKEPVEEIAVPKEEEPAMEKLPEPTAEKVACKSDGMNQDQKKAKKHKKNKEKTLL